MPGTGWLCFRCRNNFDETEPEVNEHTGKTEWLCTACACYGEHVLGNPSAIEYRGPPSETDWRKIEVVAVMFANDSEDREHYPGARLEFREQWNKIEPLLEAAGFATFHGLFFLLGDANGKDATNPLELAYVLMQCRRYGTPLAVSDVALLPFGAPLDGLNIITPYRAGSAA